MWLEQVLEEWQNFLKGSWSEAVSSVGKFQSTSILRSSVVMILVLITVRTNNYGLTAL